MEIIGKLNNKLVVKCDKGFYHESFLHNSGCFWCEHDKCSTYFDFLDVGKLIEISDESIIKKIKK